MTDQQWTRMVKGRGAGSLLHACISFIHSPALARGLCVGHSVQKLLHTPMFVWTVLVSEHRLKSSKLKVWTSGVHIQQNPNRQRFRLKPQTRNILLNVADRNKQKHGCSYESVYLKQTCFHVLHMKCDGLWVLLVSAALTDMEQHLFSNWKQRKPSGTCWAWTFSNEPARSVQLFHISHWCRPKL